MKLTAFLLLASCSWSHDTPAPDAGLARGAAFFSGAGRAAFVAALEANPLPERSPVEIAWTKEGRRLSTVLSRTVEDVTALSDAEFAAWSKSFTVRSEMERRRLWPLPDDLKGYGGAAERARLLQGTRDLVLAREKGEFLEHARVNASNGWLTILFVPRGGQGPSAYGVPLAEVEGLAADSFLSWRRRFLRWLEVHTPGQSQVTKLAGLSEQDFEREFAESKDRHGAREVERARDRFRARTGVLLEEPRWREGRVAPVVASNVGATEAGAASALQQGEVILAVEGDSVREWDECIALISAYGPGSTLELSVAAGEARKQRRLTLR